MPQQRVLKVNKLFPIQLAPLFQKSPHANELDLHENRTSKQNWSRMKTRFNKEANSSSKNELLF